ncbi:TonB-dependent receptor [candidate division KSB1 bacterium]|nr:TonB-dependent receptor [candidate division KSB1 bacterium]
MKKTLLVGIAALFFLAANGQQDTTMITICIDEISVKATKTNAKMQDLPQKVEVISSYELKAMPAKNVGDAITSQSGVDIIKYPGVLSSISMRGFAPTTSNKYSALLINGMPAGTKNIASLGLSNVEQIEILKGPFSSMYGSSAMAGVINIVTPRHKNRITGNATVSMGSFMTSNAVINVGGKIAGPFNFDLSLSSVNQGADYTIGKNNMLALTETEKAILDVDTTAGATFNETKFSQHSGSLRLGIDISENWEVHFNQSLYAARDILSHGSFWSVYNSNKKNLDRFTERVEIEGKLKDHSIHVTPFYSTDISDNFSDNTNTAFVSYRGKYQTYGVQVYDQFEIKEQSLVIGYDNTTHSNQTQRWSDDITEIAPYTPNYSTSSNAVFLQGNIKLLQEKLHISAGARYDYIMLSIDKTELSDISQSKENYSIFNPNIGAKYNLLKGLSAHASWGTAFYAPDATQKAGEYTYYGTLYKGNADLEAETSQTLDVGVTYHNAPKGLHADITWFTTKHENLIQMKSYNPDGIAASGDEYKSYYNAYEANMQGLEIDAYYNVGTLFDNKFICKIYANATIMLKADVQVNDTLTEEQLYVRDKNANFGVDICALEKLRVRFNGRYIGSRIENNWFSYYPVRTELNDLAVKTQPEYAEKGYLKHPDFLVFDASLMYSLTSDISLCATFSNIFDENYTEKDGYNMPGRSFEGKIVFKL